jgi:hypothetical protein
MFGTGFHHQTPGRIITAFINLGMAEPERGGFKATFMPNGNRLAQALSYGFTENVSIL